MIFDVAVTSYMLICSYNHARCESVIDHSNVGNSEGDSVSSDNDVSFLVVYFFLA
jgi:hypothetical protein